MKIRTRIATAVTVALTSMLVAAPTFAVDGKVDFASTGDPLDVVAIAIVGVVLLAVALLGSTLVGNLFEKKQ